MVSGSIRSLPCTMTCSTTPDCWAWATAACGATRTAAPISSASPETSAALRARNFFNGSAMPGRVALRKLAAEEMKHAQSLQVVPGGEQHQTHQQSKTHAIASRLNPGVQRPAGDPFVSIEEQVAAVQDRYREE